VQRPDNFDLLYLLVFSGWIFVLVCGTSSHYVLRYVVPKSRFLAVRICVPPTILLLNIAVLLALPCGILLYYQNHYGYQPLQGEAPGPMSSESELLAMSFLLFDLLLLCAYALYLVSLLFKRFWGSSTVEVAS